jgi:hypothetical protein
MTNFKLFASKIFSFCVDCYQNLFVTKWISDNFGIIWHIKESSAKNEATLITTIIKLNMNRFKGWKIRLNEEEIECNIIKHLFA